MTIHTIKTWRNMTTFNDLYVELDDPREAVYFESIVTRLTKHYLDNLDVPDKNWTNRDLIEEAILDNVRVSQTLQYYLSSTSMVTLLDKVASAGLTLSDNELKVFRFMIREVEFLNLRRKNLLKEIYEEEFLNICVKQFEKETRLNELSRAQEDIQDR